MANYNRVIIMGNLTRDPDYKQLSSGQSVCRLGLASNRQFKNRQTGQMVQEVCFVDIDVWGAQADSCNQYLQKGRAVLIEGRLKLDNWVDNDGQRRSKHSIVADRVTFLASTAQQDDAFENRDENFDFGNNSEKKLQAEKVQSEPVKKPKVAKEEGVKSTGEVDLKDEQPFEDDLPF